MNKFKINNIFTNDGKTLDEVINNFLIAFLDENLEFFSFDDIAGSDVVLNI